MITVIIVYAVIMFAATFLLTKRELNVQRFMVGRRDIGVWQSAMSIAATWIWAPALFISADKAFNMGTIGLFWFLVPNIACLLIFIPFALKIRKQMPEGMTLSNYMYEKYDNSKGVRNTYLGQLSLLAVLSTAVQLLAGGTIVSYMTGMNFTLVTVIMAAIAFIYTQFSGIKASILTDAVQMILILVACAILLPVGVKINGFQSIVDGIKANPTNIFGAEGWQIFLAFGFSTTIGLLAGPFGDQTFWQRVFSMKRNKIVKSFSLGAFLFALVPLSMAALGFMAKGIGFVPESSGGIVNLELVTSVFPRWALYIFLFMLISGLLSTIDSNLCAMSSLVTDIKKDSLKSAKLGMVVVIILAIAIANIKGLTVTHMFLIYGALRGSTMLPTIMTLKGVYLSKKGVIIGVITSLALAVPLMTTGTLAGINALKITASVVGVLASGTIAYVMGRIEKAKELR